jgi:hypothetical protein
LYRRAVTAATTLRPLGIGEILDVSIKIVTRNFLPLAKLVLVVVAPATLLSEIVVASAPTEEAVVTDDPLTGDLALSDDFWTFVAALGVTVVLSALASLLATGACFKAVADSYLGRTLDWGGSVRFVLRRFGSLLWILLLGGLVVVLGLIACLVPGIWLAIAFMLAVPVLLTEGVKGRRALGRSYRLVRGRWWPVFAVIVLALLLSGIVQGALVGVSAGLSTASPDSFASYAVDFVASTIAATLTTPFTAAVTIVVYFDLRVRKEAFDLELLAQQLGVDLPVDQQVVPLDLIPPPRPTTSAAGEAPPFWPPPPGWQPAPPKDGAMPSHEPAAASPGVDPPAAQPPYWPPPPGWASIASPAQETPLADETDEPFLRPPAEEPSPADDPPVR